VRKRQNRI
ncbi:hypothetical protein CP10139811_0002B, partial [Chlamydia ibidis]